MIYSSFFLPSEGSFFRAPAGEFAYLHFPRSEVLLFSLPCAARRRERSKKPAGFYACMRKAMPSGSYFIALRNSASLAIFMVSCERVTILRTMTVPSSASFCPKMIA